MVPLVYVNRAFEALTGYHRDEVLSQNCRFLAADPADAPERQRLRAAVAARQRGQFLLRNLRKDGSPFWNQLTLDVVPTEGALLNTSWQHNSMQPSASRRSSRCSA